MVRSNKGMKKKEKVFIFFFNGNTSNSFTNGTFSIYLSAYMNILLYC